MTNEEKEYWSSEISDEEIDRQANIGEVHLWYKEDRQELYRNYLELIKSLLDL